MTTVLVVWKQSPASDDCIENVFKGQNINTKFELISNYREFKFNQSKWWEINDLLLS